MKQVGVVVRCVTFPDLYEVQLLGEDENDEVEDGAEEKVVLHRDSMEYHYALDHPDATVDQLRDLIKVHRPKPCLLLPSDLCLCLRH